MLGTKKKGQVLVPNCLTHPRAEHRCPNLFENRRGLRLVFVLARWEFQVQVRLRDALLSSLSTESPRELALHGRTQKAWVSLSASLEDCRPFA